MGGIIATVTYCFLKKTCVLVPACLKIRKTLKYKRYLKERDRGGADGLGK